MINILIIIPAYNESMNIEKVIDELIKYYPQYDYVVVNDGSKDDTADICRKKGYNLLDLPVNLGLAGAFQTGVKYAYKYGYDAALQLDGDGQHNPKYIADMVKCMEDNSADIVIGSRFINSQKPHSLRMMGGELITLIIRITTRIKICDPTSGMRLFSKNMLKEFAYSMNYGPEPDTISYLVKNGAKVSEVPVQMNERLAGESYLNLITSIKYMATMCLSIVLIQWFRKRG